MSQEKAQSLPLGEERALEVIEFGLKESSADATEILILTDYTALTRFTHLAIHQNVTETNCRVFFRTVWNNRLVLVESNDLSKAGMRNTLKRSQELAGTVTPSSTLPDWNYTVESSKQQSRNQVVTFNPTTASCDAESRARIVDRICGVFRQGGVSGVGNVRVRLLEIAVGNSVGLRRYAPFSIIALVVAATDEANQSSGYQNWIGRDIESMDAEGLARNVTMKCLMGRKPKEIEARPMTAILEPQAIAQLFFHSSFRSLGLFGARSASRGQNLIFDHLGQKITSTDISIYDDMAAEGFVPMPFDYEGVEKKRFELITNGVSRGIGHDLMSAAALGQAPTGHAQPPGDRYGPTPQHMVMEAGSSSVSDMIESTEYGVLVSRIHGFVNPMSGKEGCLSGTTRNGLFLIENGQIAGPICNFRWMDRIFSAFQTVEAISKERQVVFTDEMWFPAQVLVPTIKLGKFNFVDVQAWNE